MRLPRPALLPERSRRGSVLVIVLWVALGLVALTLYFAHAMTLELRGSQNQAASLAADQAIEGAAAFVQDLLANLENPGEWPELERFQAEAVPVGEAHFWLLSRGDQLRRAQQPVFGLIDEASKLNLNTATARMLEALPGMTAEIAAAIVDWRDSNSEPTANGAESEAYSRLRPPYRCKNAPFETVDELRLVRGTHLDLLIGEDANFNGLLDENENDGDATHPPDNRNGRLDRGLLDLVTVYSREPNTRSDGSQRIHITSGRQQLRQLLEQRFGASRAAEITQAAGFGQIRSVLEYYIRSQMKPDEFAQIEGEITATDGNVVEGLVNVNTASEEVLACIPGIGTEKAGSLVAYRRGNASRLDSIAWVSEVLDLESAAQAGPFLTSRSYQFSADVVGLGPNGRGYRRVRYVFDTSEGDPKIVYRKDYSHYGWALGRELREQWLMTKSIR